MQNYLAVNQEIYEYACFIDIEKVFDKVEYIKLVDIYKAKNSAKRKEFCF